MWQKRTKAVVTRVMLIWVMLVPVFLEAQQEINLLYKSAKELLPDNTDKADSLAKKILELSLSPEIENDSMVAKSYYLLGMVQYYKARYQLSGNYYQLALNTRYAEGNDRFSEVCLNNLGVVLDKQQRFGEALNVYHKSLRIAEKYADSTGIVESWINIALLESAQNNYEKAIEINNQVLASATLRHDTMNMALCHQNLGLNYQNTNQIERARYHNGEALRLYRSLDDKYRIASQRFNDANLEAKIGNNAVAQTILVEVVDIAEEYGFEEVLSSAYSMFGGIDIYERSDLENAESYLQKALFMSKKLEDVEMAGVVLLNLSILYARKADFEKHLNTMEAYYTLIEQKDKNASAAAYAEMKVLYEVDEIVTKNKLLEEDVAHRKVQLWLMLCAILIVSTAIGIITYLYFRLKRYVKTLYKLNLEQANSPVALPPVFPQIQSDKKDNQLYELYMEILSKIGEENLHLNSKISLQEVSDIVQSNRSYVSQAIKKYGDTNFSGLVSLFRVNTARQLILSQGSDLSLTEIADQSGFSNRVSFYRQFKEITGFSPTEFRDIGNKKSAQPDTSSDDLQEESAAT